jgi:hypothetical protein
MLSQAVCATQSNPKGSAHAIVYYLHTYGPTEVERPRPLYLGDSDSRMINIRAR